MKHIKAFYYSNQFSNGLRLTWTIVFPLFLGVLFDIKFIATAVSIGALCVGLSDSPGNWEEKAKGLIGGSLLNAICAIGMAYSVKIPLIGLIYIGMVTFLAALLAIFGNRPNMIGNSILISISLGLGFGLSFKELLPIGLGMLGGGLWYSLNSLLLWQIRPYATVEKLIGETYNLMAQYIAIKAKLFQEPSSNSTDSKLFFIQTKIDYKQDEIRSLLLTQRSALQGATPHGRSLILQMRASIDIFEKATATHLKYTTLEKHFRGTELPQSLESLFHKIGENISLLGQAISKRKPITSLPSLTDDFSNIDATFEDLRDDSNRTVSITLFAEVKNIIRNFRRIDRLTRESAEFTDYKNLNDRSHTDGLRLPHFITKPEQGRLADNLTISSSHFRHAIKISIAMMLGYICALFFELERGYWIWLSISVIMKPSFAITKQRMIARIIGTALGIGIASFVMWVSNNIYIYFLFLIPLGIGTFGTLAKDYRLGMTMLTPFILLLIAISTPTTFDITLYRIIDTALGGIIAFVISFTILPEFEVNKIRGRMIEALSANCAYFREVAIGYSGIESLNHNSYRLARKRAQLSNANLAMSFQIMLNDPKSNQIPTTDLYEFIAAIRMIFAHTATLSANVERLSKKYQYSELMDYINCICKTLNSLAVTIEKNKNVIETNNFNYLLSSITEEADLLQIKREEELKEGIKDSPNIKKLSDLVLINNQFNRIGKNVDYLKQYTQRFIKQKIL